MNPEMHDEDKFFEHGRGDRGAIAPLCLCMVLIIAIVMVWI